MIHSLIYGAATAAASKIDREKATRGLTMLAAAVARSRGETKMGRAARFVADSLTACTGSDQKVENTTGSGVRLAPQPSRHESTRAGLAHLDDSRVPADRVADQATSPRDGELRRPPDVAVLRGSMDALNCGGFGFSLFNSSQLSVSKKGTDGAVGGFYELGTVPVDRWTSLVGRGDNGVLPVRVRRGSDAVALSVGSEPADGDPVIWPTR